jgi:hypothetical protein
MYKYRELHQSEPWDYRTQTSAWVREQHIAEMLRKNEETVQWFMQRHRRQIEKRMARAMGDVASVLDSDLDTESWLAKVREEEARRAERRARREAVYQEELRRMQRRKKSETERRAQIPGIKEAWLRYESRWAAILGDSKSREPLTFGNIPWPMTSRPRNLNGITTEGIKEFLLSEAHSPRQSQKERIRAALRLWHPDRFGRVLGRVDERERRTVEDGVGIVARELNKLMETAKP